MEPVASKVTPPPSLTVWFAPASAVGASLSALTVIVTVSVDGHMHFHAVSIKPEAIDPDDPQLLEDLVLAALRDATAKIQAGQQQAMGGLDLGGMDLGGLLGGDS